jgi:ferric-dicitrate binding protein FerR (iron transport regulator)
MTSTEREDPLPVEEAAMWLILGGGTAPEADASFQAWIDDSSQRHEALAAAQRMSARLDRLDPRREIDLSALVLLAKSTGESAAASHSQDHGPYLKRRQRAPREWGLPGAALDVAAAIVVAWAGWISISRGGANYQTAIGEEQADLLSIPLEGVTDRAMLEAIETRFDLYHRNGGAAVSVIAHPYRQSGEVTLEAGEQLSIDPDGQRQEIGQVDLSKALLWQQGQLSFDNLPLARVAEELNRYSKTKIAVEGQELRARRVTGNFRVGELRPFLDSLQNDHPEIAVESTREGIVIRFR